MWHPRWDYFLYLRLKNIMIVLRFSHIYICLFKTQQFFLTLPEVFDLLCSDVHVAVNCWDCVIVLCTSLVLGPRLLHEFSEGFFFDTTRCVLAGKKDQRCLFPALIFFYKPPWNLWFIISVALVCYVVWETTNYGFFMRKGINTR